MDQLCCVRILCLSKYYLSLDSKLGLTAKDHKRITAIRTQDVLLPFLHILHYSFCLSLLSTRAKNCPSFSGGLVWSCSRYNVVYRGAWLVRGGERSYGGAAPAGHHCYRALLWASDWRSWAHLEGMRGRLLDHLHRRPSALTWRHQTRSRHWTLCLPLRLRPCRPLGPWAYHQNLLGVSRLAILQLPRRYRETLSPVKKQKDAMWYIWSNME